MYKYLIRNINWKKSRDKEKISMKKLVWAKETRFKRRSVVCLNQRIMGWLGLERTL